MEVVRQKRAGDKEKKKGERRDREKVRQRRGGHRERKEGEEERWGGRGDTC